MNLLERIQFVNKLHHRIQHIVESNEPSEIIGRAALYNNWFTPENVRKSLQGILFLTEEENIKTWLSAYQIPDFPVQKKVGLVLAGNIPLVGFHDILCVFLSGHIALIKPATDDTFLTTKLLELMLEIEPSIIHHIKLADRLNAAEVFIATGSNNSSRYFEYYFSKFPHIIRKNRNSVAVLSGNETAEDFKALATDIFSYFGLGCRNVSKLFVPEGYDFVPFFEAIEEFGDIFLHHKYKNNYDYNKSVYLINCEHHFDNGFLMLKEDKAYSSPISVVFYEHYKSLSALSLQLQADEEKIQCIVSNNPEVLGAEKLGKSQLPAPNDYADGVDTITFLINI